jgi:outer membrane protein OmpA-like peptidoglycan-associated protein
MKKIIKHSSIYFLVFLLLLPETRVKSADNKGIGVHSAPFLRVHPSARQVAMGNAFTALADEINLMRYNVGGLGNLRHIMLAANFHNWIDDTQQGSMGFALPHRFGVLGFDFTYFNEGEITEMDENFRRTGGTVTSDDILLTMGYGRYLSLLNNDLSLGASFKFLQQNLVGQQNISYAMDLGMQFRLKHISFGATIQNIGFNKVKFEEKQSTLPQTYRAGVAGRLPLHQDVKLNLTADIAMPDKQNLRYYTGGEIVISDLFAIRGGYKIHDYEADSWSAGFGLNIPMEWLANSRTRLDYAYTPLDVFESNIHRFSMLFTFGVMQRVFALNYQDRERFDEMNEKLRKELKAAEKARLAAEQAEARTRALEQEISERLARIQQIAAESEGKIEVQPKEENRILVSLRINFDFDKANIRPEEFKTMRQVGEILNTYPEAMMHISGHTDSIGTHQYNILLSKRRMDSVMVYLVRKENVDSDRFYMPVGYGELRPVADNGTSEGRFRNRRVEFLLYTMDSQPQMPDGSAIRSIQVMNSQSVRIVCNGKVNDYSVKTLSDPDRLILDFPKIFLLTSKKVWPINRGPFIRARLGYHPDKLFSRVVFDLQNPIKADVHSLNNFVIVTVE